MAIRITGLDQAIKALSAKGTKAVQAIADELEDTAKKIESNAAQDAPSYVPQMPDLKLNINQRVRSEPKKFFKGEAISWEIFVQTNPDNRLDDFDGYMEFNTGLSAALFLSRRGLTHDIRGSGMKYFKDGKGTLQGKPYFYPNVFRFTADLDKRIEKGIKNAIE
jgi:hypothetical protein